MPTYAYACTACEHRFEIVQSFTDDSLTDCPQCQGRLRKLFNAVGVVFKGSGFYRNDSRNDSRRGTGKTSRHDSGGSGKESRSGSDSASASESSSTSAESSSSSGTTKTATKSASKSEGAAA